MEKQFRADVLIDDKWKKVRALEDKKNAIGVAKKALDISGVRAARVVDLAVDKHAPHRVVWIDNRTVALEESTKPSRDARADFALGKANVPRRPNAPKEQSLSRGQHIPNNAEGIRSEGDLKNAHNFIDGGDSRANAHLNARSEAPRRNEAEAELDTTSTPLLQVAANHKIGVEVRGGRLYVFSWGLWFKPHKFNINRQERKIPFSHIASYRKFSVMIFMQTGLEVYSSEGASDWFVIGKRDQVTKLIDLHADQLKTGGQEP